MEAEELIKQILPMVGIHPGTVSNETKIKMAKKVKLYADEQSRERPKIICICGSTRFKGAFIQAQKEITMRGEIFLTVGMFGHSGDLVAFDESTKKMLGELHLRKIDLADEIYIVNMNGYIGKSTRNEINYAESLGKPIKYLEQQEGE